MFDEDLPDEREVADAIRDLAAGLASADIEQRRAIVSQIYDLCLAANKRAASAVPILIEYIADPDEKTAESAQWGLGHCGPEAVEPLIEYLSHPDADTRTRVCYALGSLGEDAITAADPLRRVLDDADGAVRQKAAWALGTMHDSSAATIEALFAMARSNVAADRASALHALGLLGEAMGDPAPLRARESEVLGALEDPDADVRWSALYLLQSLRLPPERHLELIVARLNAETEERPIHAMLHQMTKLAPEVDLRAHVPLVTRSIGQDRLTICTACELLGALGPAAAEALPVLREGLASADDFDKLAYAKALWQVERRAEPLLPVLERLMRDYGESVCDIVSEIGRPAASLAPALVEALTTDDYWDLQWAAADALAAVASDDPAVIDALIAALGHDSPIVRGAAAHACAAVGEPAVPPLIAVIECGEDSRAEWAAEALAAMGHRGAEASPALRERLTTAPRGLRIWCALALANVAGDALTAPVLLDALKDDEPDIRMRAASALAAIRPVDDVVLQALREAVDDEDAEVREAAAAALAAVSAPLQ